MNARLALLAARRVALAPLVLVAFALAAAIALGDGAASAIAAHGGADSSSTTRAGPAIEAAWTAFLALVAPCVVLRAASSRSRGEVAWTAASREGVARGEISRAAGALAAAFALVAAWSVFVAFRAPSSGFVPAFAGIADGPASPLVDAAHPLVWSSKIPAHGVRARVEVSLVISAGSGGEVRFAARRASGGDLARAQSSAHVLPRGGVEVAVPDGEGDVELELSLPEPGARGYLASDDVTLWRDEPASSASTRIAARVAIALASATLLAFGLGAWLAPLLALGLLASATAAIWISDATLAASIPGASLARDLAFVAEGRAPAPIAPVEIAGALACAAIGLALARREPEGRP